MAAQVLLLNGRGDIELDESVTQRTSATARKAPHSKTRNGCTTCKKRRIKCDETKPFCIKCRKSGRHCEGYHPPATLLFELRDNKRFGTAREGRSFCYYLENSAFYLTGYQNSAYKFWTKLGPQASHEHLSVKHALMALGAAQESYESFHNPSNQSEDTAAVQIHALEQYNKAINMLVAPESQPSTEVILICCILFTAFEIFTAQSVTPTMHVYSGLKIIRDQKYTSSGVRPISNMVDQDLTPILARLAVVSCAFGDGFPVKESGFTEECALTYDLDVPPFFVNIYAAYESMDALLKCIFRTTLNQTPAKLNALGKAKDSLSKYLIALDKSLSCRPQMIDPYFCYAACSLKMHHRVATIMANTLASSTELVFDRYTNDFEWIVAQCVDLLQVTVQDGNLAKTLFGIYLGFIPPLFFTATRCRDPKIRRQAIEVLHASARRERAWNSCTAARIAERVLEMEEKDLEEVNKAADVPERKRIRLENLEFDAKEKVTRIDYLAFEAEVGGEGGEGGKRQGVKCLHSLSMDWYPQRDLYEFNPKIVIPRKVLRAAGYAGVLLMRRSIVCQCRENLTQL